jgi:hypothetical protein
MQSLKELSSFLGLWWKKYDKISLLYFLLFLLMLFAASCKWVTAKPKQIVEDAISIIIPIDLSKSFNGMDLMGWYFWLLLLPFLFSIVLFNRISVLIMHLFVLLILLLKIYDAYVDLDTDIPFKEYVMPYVTVDKHFEMYLFFILLSASFLFGIVNIFLSKKARIVS